MKFFKYLTSGLLLFTLLTGFLLSGCKRDIPPLPTDELRNVTFKLEGFEAETMPLGGPQAAIPMALDVPGKTVQALLYIELSPELLYLYYWSFNSEDLKPDVAVDEVRAGITFESSSAESDFVNGHVLAPFEAGRA